MQSLNSKYELITTVEVKMEIRDKKARDKFLALPFEIEVRNPSKTAIAAVRKFAVATGDIASLSEVDLRVLALCYTVAEENNTAELLRKEPADIVEAYPRHNEQQEEEEVEEGVEEVVEYSQRKCYSFANSMSRVIIGMRRRKMKAGMWYQ